MKSCYACIDCDGTIVTRSSNFGEAWAYWKGRQEGSPVSLVKLTVIGEGDWLRRRGGVTKSVTLSADSAAPSMRGLD